jgi:hypothetical protein
MNISITALAAAIATVLAAIITSVGSIFVALIQAKKNGELKNTINGFWLPTKIPPKSKRNSVIIVGLGGVGKTQLIQTILRDESVIPDNDGDETFPNPEQETLTASIHQGVFSPKGENCTYYLYISDYKGQNLGDLFRFFIEQQRIPYSPMKYGWINSLIIMVDIADPAPRPIFDINQLQNRLQFSIDNMSDLALNAIFGLLTSEISYVCVFVNKVDLLSGDRKKVESIIAEKIEPFFRKVQKRSGKAMVEIILGSALTGEGIPKLLERLKKSSITLDETKDDISSRLISFQSKKGKSKFSA